MYFDELFKVQGNSNYGHLFDRKKELKSQAYQQNKQDSSLNETVIYLTEISAAGILASFGHYDKRVNLAMFSLRESDTTPTFDISIRIKIKQTN